MTCKKEGGSSNWYVRETSWDREPQWAYDHAQSRTDNISGSSGAEAGFTKATALSKDVLCKHARSNQRRSAKHKRALHDHPPIAGTSQAKK
jgi:hypothetical protein